MYLNKDEFSTSLSLLPLVSIDLIITDGCSRFLLGYRNNSPAKNSWFVPGGRIRKNETIRDAFIRIVKSEIGICHYFDEATFLGVYEHFYNDSFIGSKTSTHYVVLGYQINLMVNLDELPKSQHCEYRWFSKDEIAIRSDIHENTKRYFSYDEVKQW